MVTITVTGTSQRFARLANQIISVPYSRLSQAMRNIHRSGGKILDVSIRPISSETIESAPSDGVTEILNTPLMVEETSDTESHQTDAPDRAKRQNTSPGSKKKKR
jgi:hypothetical protein